MRVSFSQLSMCSFLLLSSMTLARQNFALDWINILGEYQIRDISLALNYTTKQIPLDL